MDDFVIIDDDIEKIKFVKEEIGHYLKDNLDLNLKKKATFLNKVDNGISFCGTRIFKNLIRIKNENAKYSILKIKKNLKEYKNKKLNEEKFIQSLASIFSYWGKYNTYRFRVKLLKELDL